MPRVSNVYSAPSGTLATTLTTINSSSYNTFVNDLVTDANAVRPTLAGGTGLATMAANTVFGNLTGAVAAPAAMTLAQLFTAMGASVSFGTNGVAVIPMGAGANEKLIVQWGVSAGAVVSGSSQTLNFPITFPNACWMAIPRISAGGVLTGSYSTGAAHNATQITLYLHSAISNAGMGYIAVGN